MRLCILLIFFFTLGSCGPKRIQPICFVDDNTSIIDTISFINLLKSNLGSHFDSINKDLPDVIYLYKDHLDQYSFVNESDFIESVKGGQFNLSSLSDEMIYELSKFDEIELRLTNIPTPPSGIKKLRLESLTLVDSVANVFDLSNLKGTRLKRLLVGGSQNMNIVGDVSSITGLDEIAFGGGIKSISNLEYSKISTFRVHGNLSDNILAQLCMIHQLKEITLSVHEIDSIGCISSLPNLKSLLVYNIKSLPRSVSWNKSTILELMDCQVTLEEIKAFESRTGIEVHTGKGWGY